MTLHAIDPEKVNKMEVDKRSMDELQQRFDDIRAECNYNRLISNRINRKTPHKCPVCNGTTQINEYPVHADKIGVPYRVGCPACNATGIIWGPE